MLHVPYRGSEPAVADLLAGRLNAMFDSVTSAAPNIASGQLRTLAVKTGKRIVALLPNLPTVAETGVEDYAVDPWSVMLAPKSRLAAARPRVEAVVAAALRDPATRDRFVAIGAEPMDGNSAVLAQLITDETARWGALIHPMGIRPDRSH